jgi:membrane protease YdiL (CAAX protease family)
MDFAMDSKRLSSSVIAAAEVFAALLGCVLLSVLIGAGLMLLMMTPTYRAEIELSEGAGAAPDELLRHLLDAGIAPAAELVDEDDSTLLVLSGLPSAELPTESLLQTVDAHGYGAGGATTQLELHVDQLLTKVAKPYLSLQALVFLLAGGLLAHFRVRRRPAPPAPGHLRAALLGVGVGLVAFLVSLIVGGLLKLLGFEVQEQAWVLELLRDRENLIGLIPWIVVIVPVSEEVFFRGYVFRLLSQQAGLPAGLTISSLMFAIVHFNLSGFFVYFGIGLVLAYAYRRTSSIVAPIVGHMVHNAIVLSVLLAFPPA